MNEREVSHVDTTEGKRAVHEKQIRTSDVDKEEKKKKIVPVRAGQTKEAAGREE